MKQLGERKAHARFLSEAREGYPRREKPRDPRQLLLPF